MRWLLTLILVLFAAGTLRVVGCGDESPCGDCNDGNPCTRDVCDSYNTSGTISCDPEDIAYRCEHSFLPDGTTCGAGVCLRGKCVELGGAFPCTEQGIRDAIAIGGGPHTFDCEGPSTVVTEAKIEIDNDVILDGEGILTVEASSYGSVFSVGADVTAELIGMTVTGSSRSGISNVGMLTLTNATVSGNSRGGIWNSGTLTLTNSTVTGNTAAIGGGIENGGTLTLTNSRVSGNTAAIGGGINNHGTLTMTNSTVSGNTATDIVGGGILNEGTLTLTNSTVSGNTASGRDGVIYGGGIFNGGTLTLINSTISGNNVLSDGDGSAIHWQGSVVDSDCVVVDVATGTTISNGYNIEAQGDTCGFDQPTDQASVPDAMLGPLQNNGGLTETHALLPGSPAINQIPATDCVDAEGAPLATDQRGEPRPEAGGTRCDVGSFELQP